MGRTRISSQWLWVARWLALVGMVGATVLGFVSYQDLQDRLTALPRTAVPGSVTVDVHEPLELTIFYEDPMARGGFVVQAGGSSTLASSPVDLAVSGPTGESVAAVPYERDLRFGHDGRIVIAVATIDIPTAGAYTVHVSGNVPPAALVSVGDVIDPRLIVEAAGAITLFGGSALALVIIMTVAAIGHRRAISGSL